MSRSEVLAPASAALRAAEADHLPLEPAGIGPSLPHHVPLLRDPPGGCASSDLRAGKCCA
ncbi:hypothetical protein D3C59_17405 [Streptomyces sp. SHP22-7]|nr:hypothetical protein NI25_07555 [Streptomyces sp. CCM_MD2014]RIH60511.1 hypothetical protein D3C59_17405 [Streptomyces sp. SHP22-7]